MNIDFSAIAEHLLTDSLGLLQQWFPAGKLRGREFTIGNVKGDAGDSMSVNIDNGKWHDLATGDRGGDLISLYAAIHGIKQGEAAKRLGNGHFKDDLFTSGISCDKIPTHKHGRPSHVWEYKKDGATFAYVCRYDTQEGKQFAPLTCWYTPEGKTRWKFKKWPGMSPLYWAGEVREKVLVVEGEKTADAAQKLLPDWSVVTWPGGASTVKQADWSALTGKACFAWPDNDSPGIKAMQQLKHILPQLRIVQIPSNTPEKWDLADAPEDFDAGKHLKDQPAPATASHAPFRALGYHSGVYYYYSRGEQAVVGLNAMSHTKNSLYRLASATFWTQHYPSVKKDDFSADAATGALMQQCQKAGIFTIDRVRGRGVWIDKGKVIIHYGDRVTVDGVSYLPFAVPDRAVYELGAPLGIEEGEPIKDSAGAKFVDLMKQLGWLDDQQFIWFSGWIACAMIGGALDWRPHIWLTGAAQSGKSTIAGIIKKILGKNSLFIQSVSTEAGIRQTLGADALPIIMDEAEREDAHSHNRIQSILTLARQSSSNKESAIVKGSPSGKAMHYLIRSCFCLSSINAALMQTADKGRFSIVELGKKLTGEAYKQWAYDINELLTPEYINGLYNKIIQQLPAILHNAEIFSNAIEAQAGDKRLGDQYGTLYAGYLAFYSKGKHTKESAEKIISTMSFDKEKDSATGRIDQYMLLDRIMQHIVKMPTADGYREFTVADLCDIAHNHKTNMDEAERLLGHIGIKVTDGNIYIANHNKNLADILRDSNWPQNWNRTLKRLPGAELPEKPIYFCPGCKQRSVYFSVNEIL